MKIGRSAAPLLLLLIAPVALHGERILLTPEPSSMVIHADVPLLGGDRFSAVLPKVLGDRDHVWINEPQACTTRWEGPGLSGEWTTTPAPGTSIDYRITLTPHDDRVEIVYTVTNRGGAPLPDVWMLTYFAPRNPVWLEGNPLDRIKVPTCLAPWPLSDTDRPAGNRPELAVYTIEQAPPLPHYIRALQTPSKTVAIMPYLVGERPDGASVEVEVERAAFLFNNRDLASLHAAPAFGTIAPGASVTVKGSWIFRPAPTTPPATPTTGETPP